MVERGELERLLATVREDRARLDRDRARLEGHERALLEALGECDAMALPTPAPAIQATWTPAIHPASGRVSRGGLLKVVVAGAAGLAAASLSSPGAATAATGVLSASTFAADDVTQANSDQFGYKVGFVTEALYEDGGSFKGSQHGVVGYQGNNPANATTVAGVYGYSSVSGVRGEGYNNGAGGQFASYVDNGVFGEIVDRVDLGSGVGVSGQSGSGYGVLGQSRAAGVRGEGTGNGNGGSFVSLNGTNFGSGYGVIGQSGTGIGIYGYSDSNYGLSAGSGAGPQFHLDPGDTPGHPSGTFSVGDVYTDSNGIMYAYTTSGWQQLNNTGSPTAARIASFRVLHTPSGLQAAWEVADARGIVGFDLVTGGKELNAHLIPVHPSRSYSYAHRGSVPGRVTLHIVLNDGQVVLVRPMA